MHTYIHTHAHTYIHTYIPRYIHPSIQTYIYIYICIYIHIYTHHTYIHTHYSLVALIYIEFNECVLNRTEMTKRACTTNHQTADDEKCEDRSAHFDQENKSSRCCDHTTASASSNSQSPTLTAALLPCCRYQRNASQVKVNSEAHIVWWSSVVAVKICDACSKAQFLKQSFWLSQPYKRLRRVRTARRRCQAVVT